MRESDQVNALDKMAKILGLYRDADTDRGKAVAINQVTVVLSHGQGRTSTETHQVVDGAAQMLGPSEEEPSR